MQKEGFKNEVTGELSVDIPTTILNTAIEWIAKNCEPQQVFDQIDLEKWAESNGYTKE